MQKYNIELKFLRSPNDDSPITGVCCFSELPDNVSREEIQRELAEIIMGEFRRVEKTGKPLDLFNTSMVAMQQVAQKHQCCSFLIGVDGITTFMMA